MCWVGGHPFVNAGVGAQALWQLRVEADERTPYPPAGRRGLGACEGVMQWVFGLGRNHYSSRPAFGMPRKSNMSPQENVPL